MQECVLCEEYITNPLCPECIGAQIKTWLLEAKPELIDLLDLETSKLSQHLFNKNFCISCKKDMDVCSYCYTEHVLEWLEDKLSKELLSDFVKFFHYDFHRKGYFEKARVKGLI
ncbi:hypothetical protein KO361_05425 [Candidatus Woesearchaeota archaeon]|nr:hypothetical protein [Candidatus Woesearchaeota archaeon]